MRPRDAARPVDEAYLERAAVHYLERYASTVDNLARVLARKARRRLGTGGEAPPGLDAAIAAVVERALRSGLVDDARYAEMKVASLARRGTSPRDMRGRLRQKGVTDAAAATALAATDLDELALARRHAERKRLGPYRPRPDPSRRERDLAALCRAGFAYRIAAEALAEPAEAT